jgi:hypothetical protein
MKVKIEKTAVLLWLQTDVLDRIKDAAAENQASVSWEIRRALREVYPAKKHLIARS